MTHPIKSLAVLQPATNIQPIHIPLFADKVPAGFPSPAADYVEDRLSLDEDLIRHKEYTFFVRAKGNSMDGAGIFDGDLLVVDKSLEAKPGSIVIAVINGEFTVKRLVKRGRSFFLKPENPRYKEIEIDEAEELEIWGVVTSAIKKYQ